MNQTDDKLTSRCAVASLTCAGLAVLFIFVGFGFAGSRGPFEDALICIALLGVVLLGAAFVLGVVSLFILVIHREFLKGWLYAIAALTISVTPVLLIESLVRDGVKYRKEVEKSIFAKDSLEVLGRAMHGYAQNHDNVLPVADEWCDALLEFEKGLSYKDFKNPKLDNGSYHYAFNKHLSKMSVADIPGDVVLLFEAEGDWNLKGAGELVEHQSNDRKVIGVLYVDGTTELYWFDTKGVKQKGGEYRPLRWKP